ncbi:MAG: DUF481 domain-containing protein [Opitutaceae bacterium]
MNQNTTKSLTVAAALLSVTGLFLAQAGADTLTLSDGSILNGQIVRIEGGEITLSTAYAGELKVKQAQVTEIVTTEPVYVQTGPSTVFGTVTTSIDGLKVAADGADLTTTVPGVEAVWRTGDQSPQEKAMARNWSYSAALGMSGKSGNNDRFAVLANFNATLKGPDDKLTFYGSYDYSKENDNLTADELKGGVDYSRSLSKTLNWYVRTELESDDAENLDLRSTTAGGAGYVWKDTEAWRLELRGGLAYRYESFKDGTTNDVPGLDFVFLNTYTFTGVGKIKTVITWNPAFEDFGNYRFFHESVYEMPIGTGNKWRIQVGLANDYTSRPNGDLKKMDTTYFTRFVLEWN